MADFMQGLDPGKLILSGATLAFLISPFSAPSYNLPIFLFGALVHESSDAFQSLKLFAGLLSASSPFRHHLGVQQRAKHPRQTPLHPLVAAQSTLFASDAESERSPLVQIPTTLTVVTSLRQRGSQFMGIGADVHGPYW
ncbi:hypothetical protein JVU11DRAFT_8346 [Chiua virens]|nr:hypothetical protein JVU11DRAFT_8346 [Chiua virens]